MVGIQMWTLNHNAANKFDGEWYQANVRLGTCVWRIRNVWVSMEVVESS